MFITDFNLPIDFALWTTCPGKITKSGVIHAGISDHSYVYAVMGKERNTSVNGHKYSINRNYKHFDDVAFKSDMYNVNWFSITTHANIDDAVNDFESKFSEVANRHAPLREINDEIQSKDPKKIWERFKTCCSW